MGIFTKLLSKFRSDIPEGHELYTGNYHDGKVKCVVIPNGKENIFDGDFYFKDSLGHGSYQSAEGQYVRNVKVGEWCFERDANRRFKQLYVTFDEGRVKGELRFLLEEEVIGGVCTSSLTMQVADGKIVGPITGMLRGGKFRGECDEDGYCDGTWTLVNGEEEGMQLTEIWNHGRLDKSYKIHIRTKERKESSVNLLKKVNYHLEADIHQLLAIVRRGTFGSSIMIKEQKSTT